VDSLSGLSNPKPRPLMGLRTYSLIQWTRGQAASTPLLHTHHLLHPVPAFSLSVSRPLHPQHPLSPPKHTPIAQPSLKYPSRLVLEDGFLKKIGVKLGSSTSSSRNSVPQAHCGRIHRCQVFDGCQVFDACQDANPAHSSRPLPPCCVCLLAK
jgi:hypothetical protein